MSANDHLQVVRLTKFFDAIRTECDKARAARVGTQPHDAVILGGVAAREKKVSRVHS
jgi:hypothetical protein